MALATNLANAVAGTPLVTFTGGSGSGTQSIQIHSEAPGSFTGEYKHTQLIAELPQNLSLSINNAANSELWAFQGGGSGVGVYLGLSPSPPTTVTATGPIIISGTSGTPFNVTQPTTFMNMFVKL